MALAIKSVSRDTGFSKVFSVLESGSIAQLLGNATAVQLVWQVWSAPKRGLFAIAKEGHRGFFEDFAENIANAEGDVEDQYWYADGATEPPWTAGFYSATLPERIG